MPGVLWPKFEDRTVGLKLAFTGAINDEVYDLEQVVSVFLQTMIEKYEARLGERYKLALPLPVRPEELLEMIGRKRGFLIKGGSIDLDKTQKMLLTEFRAGKFGKISLDYPSTDIV